MFIAAPPEMLEKAMRPRGVFRDYDKPLDELTHEEKAVFDVLVDSD